MKRRIAYLDVAKGIGILFVIMGHFITKSGFGSDFNTVIYSFHMPMFFIIHGLVIRKEKISVTVKKRFKTLIIPYAIFGIIYIAKAFLIDERILEIEVIRNTLLISCNSIISNLWFLPCLFMASVFFQFIIHMPLGIKVFLLCGVMFLFERTRTLQLPFMLSTVCLSVLFISYGYYINRKISNHLYGILNLFVFLLCSVYEYITCFPIQSYYNTSLSNFPFFIITAISGTTTVLFLSKMLHRAEYFCWLGENSLLIYCIHYLLLDLCNYIVIDNYFEFIIVYCTSIMALSGIAYCINKIKRYVINKRFEIWNKV